MEWVRQKDHLDGVVEWGVLILVLVPGGIAFVLIAERKYLTSRALLVLT